MSSQTDIRTKKSIMEQHKAFTQEITEMGESGKENVSRLVEQDIPRILGNPELAILALHLRQTAPPRVDPAYQEALEQKLLDTVTAYKRGKEHDKLSGMETREDDSSRDFVLESDTRQRNSTLLGAFEETGFERDEELEALDGHLRVTAHAQIDPEFQKALEQKLLDLVRKKDTHSRRRRPFERRRDIKQSCRALLGLICALIMLNIKLSPFFSFLRIKELLMVSAHLPFYYWFLLSEQK